MSRSGNKKKKADAKTRDNGSKQIERAEKRLAKALAGVDDARGKVTRRERNLAKLMERHGRATPASASADEAIPLNAPSHAVSENGTAHRDGSADHAELVTEQAEQPFRSDDIERHE